MKDSGIEWIGEIPEEWEVKRIQWGLTEVIKKNDPIKAKNILSLTKDKGVIPYEDKGNLGNKSKTNLADYKLAYRNSIVMNSMNVIIGSVGLSDYFGCVSPVYYVFKAEINNDIRFFNYIFQMPVFQSVLKKYANGILEIRLRVSSNDVLKRNIPFPNYKEQIKISNYLDKRTKQIEEIKNSISKEIENLENYKKSVITEAVTKGLDKNVEMKDSGIEWIGEIPKHWKISKIKQQYKVTLGKMIQTEKRTNNDTLENYLSSINIKWGKVDTSVLKKMWFSKKEKDIYSLNNGDILISEGGLAGTTSIYNNEFYPCYIQNAVNRVTSKENSINKFLFYWMYFVYHVGYIESICNKATIQHYTKEKVESTPLIYMSIEDQRLIVNYLDKKTNLIDDSITAKQKQLETLEEYKKSLIYEYVTGKKEVKDGEES